MISNNKLLKTVSYLVANKDLTDKVKDVIKNVPDVPSDKVDEITNSILGKATLYHDANKKPV